MSKPLAELLRPESLDDIAGQSDIIGTNGPLRKIIESGNVPNLIFYGPPGVGKTTVASIIAKKTNKRLHKFNCTSLSTADLKTVFAEINTFSATNGILLYLDEIQYFNKKQQQSLLEHTENGNITLIASTTENPYFYVYGALLSRSAVFEFKPVNSEDILPVIERAIKKIKKENDIKLKLTAQQKTIIANACAGDVRKSLNILELVLSAGEKKENEITVDNDTLQQLTGAKFRYDKKSDEHYDCISAFQKSMRGSDPDAAIHYLARILEGGDLPSACRRLMVCACEDVGLAYPQIIPIVKAAVDSAMMLGMPEARIPLADAVILVALSPKSNSAYNAINNAMSDIKNGLYGSVPRNLQNKHFDGEERAVKGQNYIYPHDFKNHYVKQQYLPDIIKDKKYYRPCNNKNENAFNEQLEKRKKETD